MSMNRSDMSSFLLRACVVAVISCLMPGVAVGVELTLWESGTIGAGEAVVLVAPRPLNTAPGTWSQSAGPAVDLIVKSSALSDTATAYPVTSGRYVFEYTTAAGTLGGRVIVTVPPGRAAGIGNRRPVAVTRTKIAGEVGQPIHLNAGALTDIDGDTLFHYWEIIGEGSHENPADSPVRLIGRQTANPVFIASSTGKWRIQYTVSDGTLESDPVTVTMTITPKKDYPAQFIPRDLSNDATVTLAAGTLQDIINWAPSRWRMYITVGPEIGDSRSFSDYPLSFKLRHADRAEILNAVAMQIGVPWRLMSSAAESALYGSNLPRAVLMPHVLFQGTLAMLAEEHMASSFDIRLQGIAMTDDGRDLIPLFDELFREYRMANAGVNLAFNARDDGLHLIGSMPKSAHRRLTAALDAIFNRPRFLPMPPPPDEQIVSLKKYLNVRPIEIRLDAVALDDALWRFGDAMDITVLFDPEDVFGNGESGRMAPVITVRTSETDTAMDCLKRILKSSGLHADFQPGGVVAVWRHTQPLPEYRSIFDAGIIQVYPLKPIEEKTGMSPEWITHRIKTAVYPAFWSMPGAVIVLMPEIDGLVIFHLPDVQSAVLTELNRLANAGRPAMLKSKPRDSVQR